MNVIDKAVWVENTNLTSFGGSERRSSGTLNKIKGQHFNHSNMVDCINFSTWISN